MNFCRVWLAACVTTAWLTWAADVNATNYLWTGAGGENWSTPTSWSPNGVPGPEDDATINNGSVTLSGAVSVRTLNFNGGSIQGYVILYGTLNWTGGGFGWDAALQVQSGSTVNVLPGGAKESYRLNLQNAGAFNWNSPLARAEGSLVNLAGGVMRLGTGSLVTGYVSCNLSNELGGRLLITTGTTLSAGMPFTTAGAVEVTNGTLTVEGHLTSTGTWLVPDGAGLTLKGGGSFAGGTKFDGPAPVTLAGGVTWFQGETVAPNLILAGGTVRGGLSLNGNLDWTGGYFSEDAVLDVRAGSAVNVLPGADKGFIYRTKIYSAGAFNWDASLVTADGEIFNRAGGVMRIRTDKLVTGGAACPIRNEADAKLYVDTSLTVPAGMPLTKVGDLEVSGGTLTLEGSLVSTGRWLLPAGAGLTIEGGADFATNTRFEGPAPVTLAGGVTWFQGETVAPNLILAGGTVRGGLSLNGNLDWTGGYFSEDAALAVQVGSAVNVLPGADKGFIYRTKIYNAGTFNWNAPMTGVEGNFSNLEHGQLVLRTATLVSGANSGVVENRVGAVFQVRDITGSVDWPSNISFDNQGALEIWQGILSLPGNYAPGATSSLKIGLGGSTAGSSHGQLAVAGVALLTGILQVERLGGFVPAPSDLFAVISCGSRGGEFDSFLGGKLGGGLYLDPVYQTNGVTLRVRDNRPLLAPGAQRLTDGNFPILLNGAIGATYGLETTTDFSNWNPVSSITLLKGTMTITHTNAGTEPLRFYRAKLVAE